MYYEHVVDNNDGIIIAGKDGLFNNDTGKIVYI